MLWREVVEDWKSRASARDALTASIVETGHDAVLWETSPSRTGEETFQQAVMAAPFLARVPADSGAFTRQLDRPIATFDNLGGDSRLVAPAPPGEFGHLSSFLRTAPAALRHELWRHVALEIQAWWEQDRGMLWVSTHGGGVPWLHVRLDPRPKYYSSALRPHHLAARSSDARDRSKRCCK